MHFVRSFVFVFLLFVLVVCVLVIDPGVLVVFGVFFLVSVPQYARSQPQGAVPDASAT